jgi:hypothetical protein
MQYISQCFFTRILHRRNRFISYGCVLYPCRQPSDEREGYTTKIEDMIYNLLRSQNYLGLKFSWLPHRGYCLISHVKLTNQITTLIMNVLLQYDIHII